MDGLNTIVSLSSIGCAGSAYNMELDGYETDLADYQLQESPFYESATNIDVAMLHAAEKFAALRPTVAAAAERGGHRDGGDTPMDVTVTVAKPKKKRVTFLPNFVQVSSAYLYAIHS